MRTRAFAPMLALALPLLAACSSESATTSGAGGTGGAGAATGATGGTATVGSGGAPVGAGGSGDDCAALSAAIATQTSIRGSCTATVRLDYTSKQIIGFQLVCGAYARVDEASARATAQADTFDLVTDPPPPPDVIHLVSGPAPTDEFLFVAEPVDMGGVAAVSARNGLSVFGGTIWFSGGNAGITSPGGPWQPSAALGPGCVSSVVPPPARGFTLEQNGSPVVLTAADVAAALDVVWHTALPDGLVEHGSILDAMVLVYPRDVGEFDPTTAEWIVLVNAGSAS